MTLKDVAKAAGVPYATVSRALSGSSQIGSETRERVLKLCDEMGYITHEDGDEARAGVLLPERVHDSFQYKAMIEAHRFRLWSPEFQNFVDADEAIRAGK